MDLRSRLNAAYAAILESWDGDQRDLDKKLARDPDPPRTRTGRDRERTARGESRNVDGLMALVGRMPQVGAKTPPKPPTGPQPAGA